MKHIRRVSSMRADAFSDFMDGVWREWRIFREAKKDEVGK